MHLYKKIQTRVTTLHNSSATRTSQNRELRICKSNPVHWINNWAWTYDPRESCTTRPFDLYPIQEGFIRWLVERDRKQKRGVSSPDFADALVLAFASSAYRFVLPEPELPYSIRKFDNW